MSCNPMFTSLKASAMANLGLAVCPNGDCSNPTSIAPMAISQVIGLADCLCNVNDLAVSIQVTTTTVPQGTAQTYEVWEGTNCDQSIYRSGSTINCAKVAATTNSLEWTMGSNASTFFYQSLEVPKLIQPSAPGCPMLPTTGNALWMLFNVNQPMADSCSFSIPANTQPPEKPVNPVATSGDTAISLDWTMPAAGSLQPIGYQILCADADGNPIPSIQSQYNGANEPGYSTCTPDGMQRKALATSGSSVGSDGGTTTTDAGFFGGTPLESSSDGRGPGMGGAGGSDGGVDGGTASQYTEGGLNHLDHRFLCSHQLASNATHARIEGLENGVPYQFIVVGYDAFGNASPSDVLVGTPQPVEDLWRRFRDEGGKQQGFCFVATAAYGSYESPFVEVLRDFRDQELGRFDGGRRFTAWYYQHSPAAATFIAAHPAARFAARQALWPVIVLAGLWMWLAAWQKALLLTLIVALAGWRRFARAVAARRVRLV